jgi:hypothetical protein
MTWDEALRDWLPSFKALDADVLIGERDTNIRTVDNPRRRNSSVHKSPPAQPSPATTKVSLMSQV